MVAAAATGETQPAAGPGYEQHQQQQPAKKKVRVQRAQQLPAVAATGVQSPPGAASVPTAADAGRGPAMYVPAAGTVPVTARQALPGGTMAARGTVVPAPVNASPLRQPPIKKLSQSSSSVAAATTWLVDAAAALRGEGRVAGAAAVPAPASPAASRLSTATDGGVPRCITRQGQQQQQLASPPQQQLLQQQHQQQPPEMEAAVAAADGAAVLAHPPELYLAGTTIHDINEAAYRCVDVVPFLSRRVLPKKSCFVLRPVQQCLG